MALLSTIDPKTRPKKVLVFGPPKSGKSLLTGELAEKYNLHWLDIESGAAVLLQLPQEYHSRINLISIPDTRENPLAITNLAKILVASKPIQICDKHGIIDCPSCKKDGGSFSEVFPKGFSPNDILVLDSVTQLTASAMAHVTKGKDLDYKLQLDDFGNMSRLLDSVFVEIQQAKFHVVCISHETEAEQEDGTMKIVPVAGSRNFSRNVAKYFDTVVYSQVKNGKHSFGSSTLFKPSILTGDRMGIAIEKSAKPSLLDIFEGKVQANNPVIANSPGAKALSTLEKLRAKAS